MQYAFEPGRWIVFRNDLESLVSADRGDLLVVEFGWVVERASGSG